LISHFPTLTPDGTDNKAKEVCKPLGLNVRFTGGEASTLQIGADDTIDIAPSARILYFH
jgi:creatine kinase